MKWFDLKEGDVLSFGSVDDPANHYRYRLVPTCGVCASVERWNLECACGAGDCEKATVSGNVRKIFERAPWVSVERDGAQIHLVEREAQA